MTEKNIPLLVVEQNEYVNTISQASRTLQASPTPGRSFASTKKNPGYVTLDRNSENGMQLSTYLLTHKIVKYPS